MNTTLYLIRHAESLANKDKLSSDEITRLSETGIEQAKSLSKNPIFADLDYIYTSPLSRAVETSEIISSSNPHLKIIKTDLIKEKKDPSSFAMKKKEEIPWDIIKANRHNPDWCMEDGESFNEVKGRIVKVLDMVEKLPSGSKVLLVTHGSFIKHFTSYILLCERFVPDFFHPISDRMETQNTGITTFELKQKYYETKPSWYLISWMSK